MPDLDLALEDCLARMRHGETVADCLERYPELVESLHPLLLAANRLEGLHDLRPSAAFREEGMARLQAHMADHPRRQSAPESAEPQPTVSPVQSRLARLWSDLRLGVAALARAFDRRLAYATATLALVFLTAFTAVAQSARPGEALYGWKLASEQVWRTFQSDGPAADLALLERRKVELENLTGSPELQAEALGRYEALAGRALSESGPAERAEVLARLRDHRQDLALIGVTVPLLEELLEGSAPLHVPTLPLPTLLPEALGTVAPPSATPSLQPVVGTVEVDLPTATVTPLPTLLPELTIEPSLTSPLSSPAPEQSSTASPSATATPALPPILPTATLPDPLPTLPPLPTISPTLGLPSP